MKRNTFKKASIDPFSPAPLTPNLSPMLLAAAVLIVATNCFAFEDNPLVELKKLDSTIAVELKYTTPENFMKEVMYPEGARCFLRPKVAERLVRVHHALKERGLGIKIFDGYRPLSVQKKMWARFPVEGYVANPAKGSNHNRGAAVDLTLVDASGHELAMPSGYDEFSERAHRDYQQGSRAAIKNREILQKAMEKEGFRGITTEWWHFDDLDCKTYPLLDLPISSVVSE